MSIRPDQQLLHYRIVEKIGEGGMGEVWRARDTSLDRDIAIKVLPASFAAEPERMVRFEREAKLLASLNHPNIAAVYGLHQAAPNDAGQGSTSTSSVQFLAMELVEGEDLAARLTRGPLDFDRAVEVALQIASALEAAHASGVVHRDLKPANILRAADGTIKVLDFGLAKAVGGAPSGESGSVDQSPTLTSAGTVAGVLMGTAAYMSPEQARGRAVDRRADVWAFSCVVYEMLTGVRAFPGETLTDILASIVRSEPDWERLAGKAPPAVIELLQRCLRKNPKERLRDAGDVALLLAEVEAGATAEPQSAPDAPRRAGPWRAVAIAAVAATILFAGLWLSGIGGRADGTQAGATGPRVEAMVLATDLPGWQGAPSLSPNGNQLLYVADDGGDRDIFLIRVGGEKPINLTADFAGKDDHPAWSPDGQRIAFRSDREGGGIFVMGATGESPLRVADHGFHPAWSPDGTRLSYCAEAVVDPYARTGDSTLWAMTLEDHAESVLTTGDAVQARWSPGGHRIAYWAVSAGQRDIWTIPADGGEPVAVTRDTATDWGPVWSPDGRWLYFLSDRGGSRDLWRAPIDEVTGELRGPLEAVTTGVSDVNEASVSADGRRIAITVGSASSEIVRLGFDPERERLTGDAVTVLASRNPFHQVSLSRDERWLAYRSIAPQDDIYIVRTDGGGRRRLTDDPARDRGPVWSPDGEWLAFYTNRGGNYEIFLIRRDGTGLRRLTDTPGRTTTDPRFSPDGRRLVTSLAGSTAIYEIDDAWFDPSAAPEPLSGEVVIEGFMGGGPWSPDGTHLVGVARSPFGMLMAAVHSLQTNETILLRREDGGYVFNWLLGADWIDERRVMLWDRNLAKAFVVDVVSGDSREVPGVPGPAQPIFADGGRTLYLGRLVEDADVWLLELSE
jgi:Tol biopolymer transport system component